MFERLGRVMYRRRRLVALLALAFAVFAGWWGTQVFGSLTGGGFANPNSESTRAANLADQRLGRAGVDVLVLYRSRTLTVDDPAFQRGVTQTLTALPATVVAKSRTYWSTHSVALVSKDRHATYAVLVLRGDEKQRRLGLAAIAGRLAAPGLDATVGGGVAINRDINNRISSDIATAETISMPVLLILLVVIFGSVAAASLPLAVGGLAILGAFTALRGLTYVTDVSVFSVNVVTILGLGLAIDYGLFMVGRFREELTGNTSVEDAVARTMATAGRTVAVSGVTVAVALSGLLIFPLTFLRSMGLGGLFAVLVAMVAALTVLPAMLGLLGHRVEALSVRRLFRRGPRPATAPDGGFWYRLAHSIMRRPALYAGGVLAILLLAGAPFLRVEFGGIDARALPAGTESRVVSEALDRDFVHNGQSPIDAVVTLPSTGDQAALRAYVQAVRKVSGVTGAQVTAAAGRTALVSVAFGYDPISASARTLVGAVRSVPAPPGGEVLVGGESAVLADQLRTIGSRLPWMGLIVVVTTFVLLFFAFGSVVLPVKAIVMNVLSLGASFGALVLIFQDGHLSGLLNFTPTGTLEATQPILVLAIVFGLSMDYEVFLMSRIREEYDRTGDNTAAVAVGLARSGRIITSAALLILVVIGLFSISGITFIKLIGVAMLIAVLVDATVVRAVLVPATMRLLGDLNWWAPAPLRGLYVRYGIRDGGQAPVSHTEPVTTAG